MTTQPSPPTEAAEHEGLVKALIKRTNAYSASLDQSRPSTAARSGSDAYTESTSYKRSDEPPPACTCGNDPHELHCALLPWAFDRHEAGNPMLGPREYVGGDGRVRVAETAARKTTEQELARIRDIVLRGTSADLAAEQTRLSLAEIALLGGPACTTCDGSGLVDSWECALPCPACEVEKGSS
jgi:hypothetical protein